MRDYLIMCCFKGVGKTTAVKRFANVIDLTDSMKSDKDVIAQAKDLMKTKHSIILLPTHKAVKEALKKDKIPYINVIPEVNCLNEYLKRRLYNGTEVEELGRMKATWNAEIRNCWELDVATISLKENEYLSDILLRINEAVRQEDNW